MLSYFAIDLTLTLLVKEQGWSLGKVQISWQLDANVVECMIAEVRRSAPVFKLFDANEVGSRARRMNT